LRNPSNGDRRAGGVPTRQEQRNKRENKPTQYLIRFDNLPTSSGHKREREREFIDSTINYRLFLAFKEFSREFSEGFSREYQGDTIHERSNPYL